MYQQSDYQQAVEWLAAGSVKVAPLITKHFSFDAYADAYRFIEQHSHSCLKVMIDL
jgi:threonine dehydrogenase-like Zn-dependent dehydrogenase